MLPTFLVIGVAKAGTTSLHGYLRQHPQVFVPAVKECNYFWTEAGAEGRATPRTLDKYARLFDRAGPHQLAVGEVSPRYVQSRGAAEKIQRELPDVKLVVSLRDPVERAWSDYLGRVRILRESRSFAEAVAPGEPCFEWGLYHASLSRFFDRFSHDRVHVILYDELAAATQSTVSRMFDFLGVDPDAQIDISRRHNRARSPRSPLLNRVLWPAIVAASKAMPAHRRGSGIGARVLELSYREPPAPPAGIVHELRARYRTDVLATAGLIGRDLSHWSAASQAADHESAM